MYRVSLFSLFHRVQRRPVAIQRLREKSSDSWIHHARWQLCKISYASPTLIAASMLPSLGLFYEFSGQHIAAVSCATLVAHASWGTGCLWHKNACMAIACLLLTIAGGDVTQPHLCCSAAHAATMHCTCLLFCSLDWLASQLAMGHTSHSW